MNIDRLRAALRYEPKTGKLFWRLRPDARPCWNSRYAGKEAFTAERDGYRCGSLDGKMLQAHRVAFAIMIGRWPIGIDHENGKRSDNRWSNIVEADAGKNRKNQRRHRRNQHGVMGINRRAETGKWRVVIGRKYVGQFGTKKAAVAARRAAEREHGYHPNHGRK